MSEKEIRERYIVRIENVSEDKKNGILKDIVDPQYLREDEYVSVINHKLEEDSLIVEIEIGASECSQIDIILYDLGFEETCQRIK